MIIKDIAQEVFHAEVYPGDPTPGFERIKSMEQGDVCNLTRFWMCAHNGTHVDAPAHFVRDGRTVDHMNLEDCIGTVWVMDGGAGWEQRIPDGYVRILVRGFEDVTLEQAHVLVEKGIRLIGTETQKMGDQDVHRLLLGHGVVLLEGIRLQAAPNGKAFLCAQPINLGGAEGAPCRPVLLYEDHQDSVLEK